MTETPEIPEAAEPCWLCLGLGGIAQHLKWSEQRGKPLWTAHEHPSGDPHPTYPCPACPTPATFTASEVKELTTKATEVALALGRKEALEEAEAALVAEGATQRALRIIRYLITPPAPPCKTCRGYGYVPDFTNWDTYHDEPKPKPCPECKGATS